MAALPNKQGGHRVTHGELKNVATGNPVWTPFPVTGRGVPGHHFLTCPGGPQLIPGSQCPGIQSAGPGIHGMFGYGIWEGPRFICNLTNFNAGRVPKSPGP